LSAATAALLAVAPFYATNAAAEPVGSEFDAGDWMVRLRGIGVQPDEGSSGWKINGDTFKGAADVDISNTIVPELDVTYFITSNLAVELIAAVTPHTIEGRKGIASYGDVGDVWLLPPTLTLQYHFNLGGGVKPYVGAGVNYTMFLAEDAGASYNNLKLDDSFGLALQAGLDVNLRGDWYLNVDVKKLWLETEATVGLGAAKVTTDVDIDPWIIGVGLGYHFGGSRPEPLK